MIKNKLNYALIVLALLAIPFAANAQYEQDIVLTVTEGDNLFNICKKYLADPKKANEIAKINRLANPDRIYPGEKIIIPVRLLKGIPYDGEVTFLRGEVSIQLKKDAKWQALRFGDRVKQGSRIRTGAQGAVEVTYPDGTSVLLRQNTTLGVLNAEKKIGLPIMRKLYLSLGRTITKVREITGSESRFEIHTPSAVAAPRGTEFRVSVDSASATRTEVLHGVVGVKGVKQQVRVNKGEGTLVRKGAPPVSPKKLLPPPDAMDLKPLYRRMPLRFNFEQIEGATRYRVMLARDADLKDVVKDEIVQPQTALDIVGVSDGIYYLQSRSIDKLGLEGMPSKRELIKVRVNPLPPFVQSPEDGAEYRQKTAQFKWLKVKDALRYHVQVAEDKEFKVIVENRNDITQEHYQTTRLAPRTYYFRVSSWAQDGYQGVWSDRLRFTIIPPPPQPPVEKPQVGESEIKIRWRNLGAGIKYHFQMAKDMLFKEILIDKKIAVPEISFQSPQAFGNYYVRTSGIDSKGYEGDFSLPQSFRVKPPPPRVQDIKIGKKEVHITWNDLGENMMYHFQMAKDEDFKQLLFDKQCKSHETKIKKPDRTGLYYIRLSSIASVTDEGDYSSIRSFEIKQEFSYDTLGFILTVVLVLIAL